MSMFKRAAHEVSRFLIGGDDGGLGQSMANDGGMMSGGNMIGGGVSANIHFEVKIGGGGAEANASAANT